ncbi:MAG: methionyl-tRNA formyltransferase [Eubacteriaceae bacterium]|jgi:methionyl-tRNA formyltransferase|nr:methionyl-tRNA formyltransferase [Eubacteriaceae bacterium]
MKIVFMGTPQFAANILKALYEAGHDIVYVVCQPDKASGRGHKVQAPPVKETAAALGLEVLQPLKVKGNTEFLEAIKACGPDMIIVAAYGRILPKELLEVPAHGCVNVHASLLPKLRGASPIPMSIVTGEKKTGVSIMRMEEGLDTGGVYAAAETETGRKHCPELTEELSLMGADLLLRTIPGIADGSITAEEQDDSLATFTGMIGKKDGLIDFRKTPREIDCMIRGYDPWPGAFTYLGGETLKVWEAEPLDEENGQAPGTVTAAGSDGIAVSAGGSTLLLKVIQVPGKKRMEVREYLKGHSVELFTVLG